MLNVKPHRDQKAGEADEEVFSSFLSANFYATHHIKIEKKTFGYNLTLD